MRLYIHDEETERHGHHDDDDGIVGMIRAATTVKLAIRNLAGLHSALAQLIKEGKTFRRVLWMTHGSPGGIAFGKDWLTPDTLRGFVGKGYEKLFPQPTKMYFSGCNVAGDNECNGSCNPAARDAGWKFLESAGTVFLQGGGYTMGWTSTGYGWDAWVIRQLVSSHSVHFSGDVRCVTFGSGGRVLERLSYDGGVLSGDLFSQMQVLAKLNRIVPSDA